MAKKLFIYALSCCLLMPTALMGAKNIYQVSSSPFSAEIAHNIGDILTVEVYEEASMSDDAKDNTTKKSNFKFNLLKMFFPGFKVSEGFDDTMDSGTTPGFQYEVDSKWDAKKTTNASHFLKTQLQVRIIDEISEGQFIIRGQRLVNINGKDKKLFITGTIRQKDISNDNTIPSFLIADAIVEIDGEIAQDISPGFFTKLLNWIF